MITIIFIGMRKLHNSTMTIGRIITVTAAQLRTPEQVVRSVESALVLRRSAMSASW